MCDAKKYLTFVRDEHCCNRDMTPRLIKSSETQRSGAISGLPRFAFDNVDDGLEEGEREVGVTGSRVQKEEQRALVDVTDLEQK